MRGSAATRARLTEDQWKQRVIDTAKCYGWLVQHTRPARTTQGWRTPIQGHAGFPDLVLCRKHQLLVVELKSDTGKLTREQRTWLSELGPFGRLWRPADWSEVLEELR